MREMEYPAYPSVAGPRLHWSAVFAGTAMTLAAMACLSMFGVGLGYVPAPMPADVVRSSVTLGLGGLLWPQIAGIIAFYAGGWFSSRLSDSGRRADGAIYGLVSWAVSTLVFVYLLETTLGGVMSYGLPSVGSPGLFVFLMMVLDGVAAGFGGVMGARLYLPVPIAEYRRSHRHGVAMTKEGV